MELSNNYQSLNTYQQQQTSDRNTIQPVKPQEPTYNNKEVYEASQGNVIRNNEGSLALTPQGEINKTNSQDAKAAQSAAEVEANKDSQRENATNYLSHQSKKSQVEIYLAVATDGSYDNSDSTASIIESLRDVQKQNNAVEAYATYQTNQNNTLYKGLAG